MEGFRIGDRVVRHVDVYDERSTLRHGLVVDRYGQRTRYGGTNQIDPELYAVRWDDTGVIERGYFRHGLDLEK